MDINEFDWADSDLREIHIEYDSANLYIFNDYLQQKLRVECLNFAGITNLCIWDDTIIYSLDVKSAEGMDNEFLRNLYRTYDRKYVYGGRSLSDGLKELKVTLANGLAFCIYALEFRVF